jgi:hypothetical protein
MAATVTAKSGHHISCYRQQAAPGGGAEPAELLLGGCPAA